MCIPELTEDEPNPVDIREGVTRSAIRIPTCSGYIGDVMLAELLSRLERRWWPELLTSSRYAVLPTFFRLLAFRVCRLLSIKNHPFKILDILDTEISSDLLISDEEVNTVFLPEDVEIVSFEGCEEIDGFPESQTVITTVEEVDWSSIQLTLESAVPIEDYPSKSDDDTIVVNPLTLDDESSLPTEEYATQYVLVEDDGEEIDEEASQQETPFLLFEDGTVKCIDQVLLLQQDDDMEEISTTDHVEFAKTAGKKPKSHVCKYDGCGRAYSSPHHLKVHERSHTNDRPYKCTHEGCAKEFNTDYSRKAHERTHTGEKPYVCMFGCGKGFKTSGDLAKHTRTHTGERPFICPLEGCEKSFVTSNACKVHLRIHTGEKPYVCLAEGCERGFSSPTNFRNHMRIHTGEKPYSCSVTGCNRKFTEYSSLYKHRLVHSPVKQYPCTFCSKVYRQLSSLSTHKRTVHGVVVSADGSELLLEQIISTLGTSSRQF